MDIIASHQHGLIEKLNEELVALAGRASDHVQRAVVLHHLYDHSRGGHVWALAEARRALVTARAIAKLRAKLNGWGWSSRSREEAGNALNLFEQGIGEAARARTAAAYCAYRMSATPPLWAEAERSLAPSLLTALSLCHAARREKTDMLGEDRDALAAECEAAASLAVDELAVERGWAAIDASRLKRVAHRLLGAKALARDAEMLRRKGWARAETELRADPALPAAFRANPAQHFYALQHALAERRRQKWRQACDCEEDAVALAA